MNAIDALRAGLVAAGACGLTTDSCDCTLDRLGRCLLDEGSGCFLSDQCQPAYRAAGCTCTIPCMTLHKPAAHLDKLDDLVALDGLVRRMASEGGQIVNASALSDKGVAAARLNGRLAELSDGRVIALAAPLSVAAVGPVQVSMPAPQPGQLINILAGPEPDLPEAKARIRRRL